MATVTTDFTTASGPRSRAERLTDGVVAGYIRALDAAAARASSVATPTEAAIGVATPTEAAILAEDTLMNVNASRGHTHETPQRAASSWCRGARGDCGSTQAKRLLEAR
jgi:hypothetical protein